MVIPEGRDQRCVTAVLVVLLALNSTRLFGNEEASRTPVHAEPLCADMEPMWLQAQAVPTAELVPCVHASLPLGWSFGLLTVNNGRSTMTVDRDRAGSKAISLRFTESCDITGATAVTPDVPGARRFERDPIEGTNTILTWYEVFPGGCATVRLSSRTAAPEVVDDVTEHAGRVIGFVTPTSSPTCSTPARTDAFSSTRPPHRRAGAHDATERGRGLPASTHAAASGGCRGWRARSSGKRRTKGHVGRTVP